MQSTNHRTSWGTERLVHFNRLSNSRITSRILCNGTAFMRRKESFLHIFKESSTASAFSVSSEEFTLDQAFRIAITVASAEEPNSNLFPSLKRGLGAPRNGV